MRLFLFLSKARSCFRSLLFLRHNSLYWVPEYSVWQTFKIGFVHVGRLQRNLFSATLLNRSKLKLCILYLKFFLYISGWHDTSGQQAKVERCWKEMWVLFLWDQCGDGFKAGDIVHFRGMALKRTTRYTQIQCKVFGSGSIAEPSSARQVIVLNNISRWMPLHPGWDGSLNDRATHFWFSSWVDMTGTLNAKIKMATANMKLKMLVTIP